MTTPEQPDVYMWRFSDLFFCRIVLRLKGTSYSNSVWRSK